MSHIVIFGSARNQGRTREAVDHVFKNHDFRFVDLKDLKIAHFDYHEENQNDDFIPLMEELVTYDTIVLASPVYWYAISSYLKIFIDRWSELLSSRKDLARKLERKRLFVICSFATDFPLGCASFESPIRQTCNYMNITYGGCYYKHPDTTYVRSLGFPDLEQFQAKLFDKNADLDLRIHGPRIQLRLAMMSDRETLYQWIYHSDASLETVQKSFQEFKTNWNPYYFQMPLTGRGHVFIIEYETQAIGAIAFHRPDPKGRSEMDIWLGSEKFCGKGFASETLDLLCRFLYRELGIAFFWLQPSARNLHSIHASEKAQFRKLPLMACEGKNEFGLQDHPDSVYLLRDMSVGCSVEA